MALPETDREHIGQHLALMLERMEAGTARLAQSVAEEKAGMAAHTASRERTRAETAEVALSQTVTTMLVAESQSTSGRDHRREPAFGIHRDIRCDARTSRCRRNILSILSAAAVR